jgi:hypothetical protein
MKSNKKICKNLDFWAVLGLLDRALTGNMYALKVNSKNSSAC